MHLLINESMSGWRTKTSKTGGLLNITHEARKPVPLGRMICNTVDCVTVIFAHHDIVQGPVQQCKKKYSDPLVTSNLSMNEDIQYHVAEVLRQAEISKVVEDDWVGDDAWFGSINTAVELKARPEFYSTFIVEPNLNYFPMQVLHAILVACYCKHLAGHWVTAKANISGVDLHVMAYD